MSTLFSVADAAHTLNISEQRVRTLCRTGAIKAEMVGTSWVIRSDNVSEYSRKIINKVVDDHHCKDAVVSGRPVVLSFFSGAMGLDLGLEKSGFDIRLACELDSFCRQTISHNKPEIALLGNINNYSSTDILESAGLVNGDDVDLIVGGPPCQAFSTAGKRKAFNDDRGNVFLKYISIALEIRPKYFVIENVRGLLSCPLDHIPHSERSDSYSGDEHLNVKGGALNLILGKIRESGYGYSFNLYNSANFGSPQSRERVIIVCSRDGKEPPFLTPTHSESGAFGLPRWETLRGRFSGIDHHDNIEFPEKRLKYYRLLKEGENWKNLPNDLQKLALGNSYHSGGGKTGFLRRLSWNKPSPTLVTHPAMPATDLAHPSENRPLSVQEYMRIQEFPDDWFISGPLIQRYKQIGNAVPLSLGAAVGKMIKKLLKEENIETYEGFKYSRYKGTSNNEWECNFNREATK